MTYGPDMDKEGRMKVNQVSEFLDCIKQGEGFCASTGLVSIADTNETNLMLIRSDSDTGKMIRIKTFFFSTDDAATRSIFTIYRAPTVTDAGTLLAAENLYIESSPPVAKLKNYKSPTTSAEGTFLSQFILPADSPTTPYKKEFLIDPNFDLLITVTNNDSGKTSNAGFDWAEFSI